MLLLYVVPIIIVVDSTMLTNNRVLRINILALIVMLLTTIGGFTSCTDHKIAEQHDNTLSNVTLPDAFAAWSDSTKIDYLLNNGFTIDSIASFVIMCAEGSNTDISFNDYDSIEYYINNRLGSESAQRYGVLIEANLQTLPLAAKYSVYLRLPIGKNSLLGYNLGLEYVDRILNTELNLGRIDLEIAEFHRACGSNEGVFEDFLDGFAAALKQCRDTSLSPEIISKYGSEY